MIHLVGSCVKQHTESSRASVVAPATCLPPRFANKKEPKAGTSDEHGIHGNRRR